MFSDPQKIIDQCGIQPGMDIADIGSGSGHYAFLASHALMSTGRVYAIDLQKELLTKLKNEAVRQGLYNIEVIWGNAEKLGGTKLRESSVDLVLVCNILFQIEDKKTFLNEVKRVLRPGGRVLLVDWNGSFGGIGPEESLVVAKADALENFEKNGFHLERDIIAGSHHYGILMKKL